jgi:hypothetical protein
VTASDVVEQNAVAVPSCDPATPGAEFRAVPLEAMVRVTHPVRRHAEQHVELGIRRRDDHGDGPRVQEYGAFERGQAPRRQMLDRLDQHGGVEAREGKPRCHHAALHERHLRRNVRGQIAYPPARGRHCRLRQVDPHHAPDLRLVCEPDGQDTVPAAKIEHRRCARLAQCGDHRLQPFLVLEVAHRGLRAR